MAGAAALLVAAGCADPGHPIPARPDLAALDLGPFASEPQTAPRNDNPDYGRVLESIRMGEAVIDPVEADATLRFGLGTIASVPIPVPEKAGFLAQPVRAVLKRHGMLAGFSVGGMDQQMDSTVAVGRARLLTVLLLRFPDQGAAERAAADIDAVDKAVSPDNVAVPIPEHTGAQSHWRPAVPTLAATMADGPFVISVLAGATSPDLATLTGLARAAFTAQVARLRGFTPTPEAQLATLPLDAEGLLGRVLPEAPGVWPAPTVLARAGDENAGWRSSFQVSGVVYGPRAAHRVSRKDSTDIRMALNGSHAVRRYPDAVTARKDYTESAAEEATDPELRAAPPPAGLPDVICYEGQIAVVNSLKFGCRLLAGRYGAILYGRSLRLVHQKAAAQYALLLRDE
ncbi:hypothetical protein [Nocardia sp. NPDC048505]|uniref:DUF7373 family lipoprotein n=1 Tax=unclassified Nocardia TaxID=2637762 RepID=UPI0033C2C451